MQKSEYNQLAAPLWLLFRERELLVGKALSLIRNIDEKGSISRAADAVPMSYKSAWDLIDRLNNSSVHPMVTATTGGRNGGGAKLTPHGKSVLQLYSSLERNFSNMINSLDGSVPDIQNFFSMMKGLLMRTSARNQLAGTVQHIQKGMVNSQIKIAVNDETMIAATITNESVINLELKEGVEVIALIKASSVVLFTDSVPVKCSLDNMLYGKVVEIVDGSINSEVIVDIGSEKTITAIVTKESVETIGIKNGNRIFVAFSASQVILALSV
ncbi:MAG TPA: TOBE domain-containing protein [Chitinispirillaceae bacterium]|nr:TOBE domain-containing protein [Chitinispirillaceae bacterium]